MTDATVLADALVEAELAWNVDGRYALDIWMPSMYSLSATDFITDWRVAGKVLELMQCQQISRLCKQSDGLRYHGWLRKPRTIIEAWYEARQ